MKLSEKLVWGFCVVMGVFHFFFMGATFKGSLRISDGALLGTVIGIAVGWLIIGWCTLWVWGTGIPRLKNRLFPSSSI